jgi:hypothetical protein
MFPDMPANALQSVKVDHVVPLSEISATLVKLVEIPAERRRAEVSEEVAIETAIALWQNVTKRMKGPHLQDLARFYRAREMEARRDAEKLRRLLTRNGNFRSQPSIDRREGSRPRVSAASAESAARRRPARQSRRSRRSPQT